MKEIIVFLVLVALLAGVSMAEFKKDLKEMYGEDDEEEDDW